MTPITTARARKPKLTTRPTVLGPVDTATGATVTRGVGAILGNGVGVSVAVGAVVGAAVALGVAVLVGLVAAVTEKVAPVVLFSIFDESL